MPTEPANFGEGVSPVVGIDIDLDLDLDISSAQESTQTHGNLIDFDVTGYTPAAKPGTDKK